MKFDSLDLFLRAPLPDFGPAPIGILLCESPHQASASAERMVALGVGGLITIGHADFGIEPTATTHVHVAEDVRGTSPARTLNRVIDRLAGRWVHWLWNGEFLFYPFCGTRSLSEMVNFLSEERRASLYTYAFDLYGKVLPDPGADPRDVELAFDRSGYHAFEATDEQLRVFGSLGWRFEEFVPADLQNIGRTALFRADRGVRFNEDMTLDSPRHASVACPWHHNPTGAVMSLRRTRRIVAHPRFDDCRDSLDWSGSERFDWTDRQLLDLGMIEPGQWF